MKLRKGELVATIDTERGLHVGQPLTPTLRDAGWTEIAVRLPADWPGVLNLGLSQRTELVAIARSIENGA